MKAKKNMYPGGGMLRNKYAQGGAVRSSSITPAPKTKPIGRAIGDAIRKNPTLMRMYGFQAMLGASQPTMPARATASPSPYRVANTSAPSRAVSVTPASMVKRPVATMATPATKPSAPSTTAKPPVTTAMSFSKAFAEARAKGLKEFTWQGKKYNTMLKGEAKAPVMQRAMQQEVAKMPMKAVTSISKPYFESPTGVMQPASVKTAEMRGAPMQKMPVRQATSVQQSQPQAMATTDNKKTGYFKPGTMAEYLEERRRKMQSNLMAKK
jgi:hypothetical protein